MLTQDFYYSVKEIKEEANDCLRGSWKDAAKATAIYLLLNLLLLAISVLLGIFVAWWAAIPAGIISLLLIAIFHYGYTAFCLELAKEQNPAKRILFSGFSKRIGDILRIEIKKFFLYIVWLVMLIVPFFYKAIGYSMATLLLCDRMDIKSETAIKESKHIMGQNYGRYAKLILSFFWWYLLVLISVGVAFVWVAPKVTTAKAVFYQNLKTEF